MGGSDLVLIHRYHDATKSYGGDVQMVLGYDRPLFILRFDQRSTFERALFGFKGPLTEDQTLRIVATKQVIFDGFRLALSRGAPRDAAGILVDGRFGAKILRDANAQGLITCVSTETGGQEEFTFDRGDLWRQHIADAAPTFVKARVHYNVENDEALNRRQAAKLQELSAYCNQTGRRLMLELLIPMTIEQWERLEGNQRLYDDTLRPSLMIAAIEALQQAGVEPDVWKVEGLDRRRDCEALTAVVRRGKRGKVGCVVLGRGHDELGVLAWLGAAAATPGFVGFAIGRPSFWDALVGLRDGALTRDEATAKIATRYVEWIRAFLAVRTG